MKYVYEGRSVTIPFFGQGEPGRSDGNVYYTVAGSADGSDYYPVSYNGASPYYVPGQYAFSITVRTKSDSFFEGDETFKIVQYDIQNGSRWGYEEFPVTIIDTTSSTLYADLNNDGSAEPLEISAYNAIEAVKEIQFAAAESRAKVEAYDAIIAELERGETAQEVGLWVQAAEIVGIDKLAFKQVLKLYSPQLSEAAREVMIDVAGAGVASQAALTNPTLRAGLELVMDGIGFLGPYGFAIDKLSDIGFGIYDYTQLVKTRNELSQLEYERSDLLDRVIDAEQTVNAIVKLTDARGPSPAALDVDVLNSEYQHSSKDSAVRPAAIGTVAVGDVSVVEATMGKPTNVSGNTLAYGTEGNDTFAINAFKGGGAVFGEEGFDILVVTGSSRDFAFLRGDGSGGFLVSESGAVLLEGVERVQFDDAELAIDVGANENAGSAYRIYKAAFARTPDADGLKFWVDAIDAGLGLEEAADGFMQSAEFQSAYGSIASDSDFIAQIYRNILGREGEAAGLNFWNDVLGGGAVRRAEVLAQVSESDENILGIAASIEDGILI